MTALQETRKRTIEVLAELHFDKTELNTTRSWVDLGEEEKGPRRIAVARKLRSIYNLHKYINADLICTHVLNMKIEQLSQEEFNVCYDASRAMEKIIEWERYH
jgi:hypothetical protein